MNCNSQTIEKMKSFINQNLFNHITSRDIAQAAGYSQFHSERIFKLETGQSPFEYLRQQRLLAAAQELRKNQKRVLDIALDYVFDSAEGFTRAFTKAFGISPKKFSSYDKNDGWNIQYNISSRKIISEVDNMKETAVIFTQIIERPARKLILRRSKKATEYFEYCEEVGCGEKAASAPWDILCGIKQALYEPVGLWLPENMRPEGTGIYAHGVEVAADYDGEIPDGFDVIDLKPCKLIVFQGEPYDDEDFQTNVGLCMDRIEKFNPQVYGYEYEPEIAPRMQLAPMGWRGYIEMRPVKEINN